MDILFDSVLWIRSRQPNVSMSMLDGYDSGGTAKNQSIFLNDDAMAKGRAVVRVIYDYTAQTTDELTITEGLLLCVTDDTDPDWLEVKSLQANTFSDSTSGLVPTTYVEPAPYLAQYTALYDYEARTEDELSFPEGGGLFVYDTGDEEWWLALFDREAGLVPANYLEITVLFV
jgi:hypothetical protein